MSGLYVITWTTRYREGGPSLERAARTHAETLAARGVPREQIRLHRVESKRDFVEAIGGRRLEHPRTPGARLPLEGRAPIRELHFFGHSGMYGPMFRTTAMPEQFSPHEWRTLDIPFAPGGEAFFHACRTARWFAPFFARTFGVPASGYHWYTTFSARPDRFVWAGPSGRGPLYLIGCRGKKSDGLVGSALKYLGLMEAEPMKRFLPADEAAERPDGGGPASYDEVAELYAEVFRDIRVRKDEWRWLERHLPPGPGLRVVDLGAGSGSLLRALLETGRVAEGLGLDRSAAMVEVARRDNPDPGRLRFEQVLEPVIPLPDASVDLVVSLLSWRYLDWDPIMDEIRRVLAPGGRLLVVDMVTAPVEARELPSLLRDAGAAAVERAQNTPYRAALRRLVEAPGWSKMLEYNPIRAKHEYVWYFESRFPGRRVETLNIGWNNRVLAFDSGPLAPGRVAPQTYP